MATLEELRASACACWMDYPGVTCGVCRDDDDRDLAAQTEIARLRAALEEIAEEKCCGCSAYYNIAREALDGPTLESEGPPEPVMVVTRGAAGGM